MYTQLIPFGAMLILFLVNFTRKRNLLCLSSLMLLYELISLATSLCFVYVPRVGDPYVNTEAMVFLAINLVFLFMPLLFLKDGRMKQVALIDSNEACPSVVSESFDKISSALIVGLLPVSIFFLTRAISGLGDFFAMGGDRTAFREGIDSSIVSNPIVAACWVVGVFFYCALFSGVLGLFFTPLHKVKNSLLLFCGSLWMFDGIKSGSRSNIFYSIIFCLGVILTIKEFFPRYRIHIPRIVYIAVASAATVFAAITISRFGENSTEEKGVAYNLLAYFASGPYCFSADYELRASNSTDGLKGFLTFGLPVRCWDKLTGSEAYDNGALIHEEYYTAGTPMHNAYQELCGTYSGEFKTIVGNFLIDFSPKVVMLVFLCASLLFSVFFNRLGRIRLSGILVVSIYVYILLTANIGFVFATFRGNLALVALLLFYSALRHLER